MNHQAALDQGHLVAADQRMPRGVWVALGLCGVFALLLQIGGVHRYPNLHTIFDTSVFILQTILAIMLAAMGRRMQRALPLWLASVLVVAAALQFLHTVAAVEWTGPLSLLAQVSNGYQINSWPPSIYVAGTGILAALLLHHRRLLGLTGFRLMLGLLCILLLVSCQYLPGQVPPGLFGVTRPAFLLAPPLWLLVALASWGTRRHSGRLWRPLAVMAGTMAVSQSVALYSGMTSDTALVIAHLIASGGYLVLLLALMQMAAHDMSLRDRAERVLGDLNATLEHAVAERTQALEAANASLGEQIREREQAQSRALAQLARLNLLQQITRAIGERQDINSIFQVAVRSVEEELPADFVCLCQYDAASHSLTVVRVGFNSAPLAMSLAMGEHATIPIDNNGLSRCVHGYLVYEPDIAAVQAPFPSRLAAVGLRAMVVAPLVVESQVFGVMVAARLAPESFSSGECEFLRQLSEHVALAAHQAQLLSALQQAYDDLRQTQQAVMQQERLRALGQMASGIAHDINNAISPVALYAESLLDGDEPLSPRARKYMEVIARAVDDVAHTVSRMNDFYRLHEPQTRLTPVDINKLVPQVVDLTRARWSDMALQRGVIIDVQTDLRDDLPPILGVESELREALINLVFNAVDAMPDGGKLTISTDCEDTAEPAPRLVCITVADQGGGMDEATRQRCLEPFFTTKGERGTGLGLAMVYGIVQRHGGELDIRSAPDAGTAISMRFPVPVRTDTPEAVVAPATSGRRLNLLLVDDDPLLLKSLRDILESEGHLVTIANGGQAGIDAFRQQLGTDSPYDAVITDLGMPAIDGRKVASAIKADSAATPVILLTGWGQRMKAEDTSVPYFDVILPKPPKLRDLHEALARCRAVTT